MCEFDCFIEEKIEEGYFPGCVIHMGNKNETIFHKALGFSELIPIKREMKKDSIFDIASLTKPFATAVSILRLVDSGMISLNTQVGSILMELQGTIDESTTVFELMTHTSSIPAWYPLYFYSLEEKEIIRFIGTMKTEKSIYSCLNYILLGEIVERVTGETLKEFSETNIFKPLSMKDTIFNPPDILRERFVATEVGNRHERELSKRYIKKTLFEWREKTIVGEVHDGNCFYCFNGISGNSGLFSTASDLARFARLILQGGNEVLKPEMVQFLLKTLTFVRGEKRSIGFLIGGDGCGRLSQKTIWHTGFTGCALWIDPLKEIFIVFLSNAVHPEVRPNILKPIRPQIINHCLNIAMKL